MDRPGQPTQPAGPSTSPTNDRWEMLKDKIEQQYLKERLTVPNLVKYMKDHHDFHAGPEQYKYHFKKWKWGGRKNVPAAAKNRIGRHLHSRAEAGRPSTSMVYNGQEVAPQKMRRYLKDTRRSDMIVKNSVSTGGVVANAKLSFGKNIFTNLNAPFAALAARGARFSSSPRENASSPLYGDITVETPPSTAGSPGTLDKQIALQRRLNSDALKRVALDRARLFMQGRHQELMRSLNEHDVQIMNEWLYQFWLFSFKTAKHWGQGPRNWTAAGLRFNAFEASDNSNQDDPTSPSSLYGRSPGAIASESIIGLSRPLEPSQLCNWAIHVRGADEDYQPTPGPPSDQDPHDETAWQPWPPSWRKPPLQERLRDGLEHNDFSTLKADELPVAIPQVAKTVERAPNEMLLESLSFAIMCRNAALVEKLLGTADKENVDIHTVFPFHLAASYLDGSKTCCSIFLTLVEHQKGLGPSDILDDSGRTIVDRLMALILRSHTRVLPRVNDPTDSAHRFPGDELDICGRWDADSDCYRHLLSRGNYAGPAQWKHKFCHTSTNAICDIIHWMNRRYFGKHPPSGMFSRLCTNCGLQLKMSQLHAMVITAFHLANSGFDHEDLFGMIACTLQLMHATQENPFVESPISLALLDIIAVEERDLCTHENLSPTELARQLGSLKGSSWSSKVLTGWEVFSWVLDRGEQSWRPAQRFSHRVCAQDWYHPGKLRENPALATLWAAVKTELLTYRRVNIGDPWISDNFDMERLLAGLKTDNKVSIKLVEEGLMKPLCECGDFKEYKWGTPYTMNDVSESYFSNMEIWDRATYLPV